MLLYSFMPGLNAPLSSNKTSLQDSSKPVRVQDVSKKTRIYLRSLIRGISESVTSSNPDYSTFDVYLEGLAKYPNPDVLHEAISYAESLDTRKVDQNYKDSWLVNLGKALDRNVVKDDFRPLLYYSTSESPETRFLVMVAAYSSTPRRMTIVSSFLGDKDPYVREISRSFVAEEKLEESLLKTKH